MNATIPPDDEELFLTEYFYALNAKQLKLLLAEIGEKGTGNKSRLVASLMNSLSTGTLSRKKLVDFLNETDRWGKQHVFLYGKPSDGLLAKWSSSSMTKVLSAIPEVASCLNIELPLVG